MEKQRKIFNTNITHYPINSEWAESFSRLGFDYVGADCSTETDKDVIRLAQDAEILQVPLFSPISRKVFESLTRLKAIVKHGIGYENIDTDAAKEFGVWVSNTPGFCAYEVSCTCVLLLLAAARHLTYWHDWIRAGNWKPGKPPYAGLDSLRGERIGLIGFGVMGQEIYQRLLPFEVEIVVYDPFIRVDRNRFTVRQLALEELLQTSKYIVLICAQTKDNLHMIDEAQFKLMRPDAVFMNIARGRLVNEPVMIRYLQEHRIGMAALDVFEQEPISPDNPLLKLDNVILTPHQGGMSPKAKKKLDEMVYAELMRLVQGQKPEYLVREMRD